MVHDGLHYCNYIETSWLGRWMIEVFLSQCYPTLLKCRRWKLNGRQTDRHYITPDQSRYHPLGSKSEIQFKGQEGSRNVDAIQRISRGFPEMQDQVGSGPSKHRLQDTRSCNPCLPTYLPCEMKGWKKKKGVFPPLPQQLQARTMCSSTKDRMGQPWGKPGTGRPGPQESTV